MTVVVGIYIFVGNSGVLSFGHMAFMCIGAYAVGWATIDPSWKQLMLTGLPEFLQASSIPSSSRSPEPAFWPQLSRFSSAQWRSGCPASPPRSRRSPFWRSSTASIRTGTW